MLGQLAGTPITAEVATGPGGERLAALGLDGPLLEDWELLVPDADGELWLSPEELDGEVGGWRRRQRLGHQPLTMRARIPSGSRSCDSGSIDALIRYNARARSLSVYFCTLPVAVVGRVPITTVRGTQ